MIREIKRVEAVVVYNVDLRVWKGKILKLNLKEAGISFEKSKGAVIIEANDGNVEWVEGLVKSLNYEYNVDRVVEYVEIVEENEALMQEGTEVVVVAEVGYKGLKGVVVGEAYTSRTDGKKCLIVEVEKVGRKYLEVEEVEMIRTYLLNKVTNVISVEGDVKGADYEIVKGAEVEVDGGFAIIGTKENGEQVEAFLSEEAYFGGEEFVVEVKKEKKVVKNKKQAVRNIVKPVRVAYINPQGKELEHVYAIDEKDIDVVLEELDKIAGLKAEYVPYNSDLEGKVGQIEVKHHGNGRSNTIIDIWVFGAKAEEVEEEIVEIDGFPVYGGSMVRVSNQWIEEVKDIVKDNGGLMRGDEITIRVNEDANLLSGWLRVAFLDIYNNKRVWNELDGSLSLKAYLSVKELIEEYRNSNKAVVVEFVKEHGYNLGCYDEVIDSFKLTTVRNLLNSVDVGCSSDIVVSNGNKTYVVSVAFVVGEVDFITYTQAEYIREFGEEKFLED